MILNGRYAGRKGIIVKSNYENNKERKYPHCLVVGLSKGPRKATKRSLKKIEEKIKSIEKSKSGNVNERLNKMKSLGIFIKTYNMAHLLVTRYTVKEDLGTIKGIERLDAAETQIKETKILLKKESEKKVEEVKQEENQKSSEESKKEETPLEKLKKRLGQDKDNYKSTFRDVKMQIGSEMLNRFMQGFVSGTTHEEKEKEEQTHFLFKKLSF